MEREPIKTDADTAEVWRAAERRRASDLAALRASYARKRSAAGAGNMVAAGHRRFTMATALASLLAGVMTARTHHRPR